MKIVALLADKKNIVYGNISHVNGDVRIGDETHHHYNTVKLAKELTFHLPQIHPDDIIGRELDLQQLNCLLNEQKRVVVVNGMGGIGKTTLAQAYIHQFYDQYQHIAWITQTSENIQNDVVNATGLIQTLGIDADKTKPEDLFNQIILKLKGISEQPNLLIIDNAGQSFQKYRDIFPGQPNWHLLLTSRETVNGFYQQELGFLNEEKSVALFKKYYQLSYLGDQEIKDLVTLVDFHTLTIEILAKMAVVQRYDIQKLKKAIQDNLRANIQVAHNRELNSIERVTNYLQTVFTFTQTTENELWLMKQLAGIPTEFHTYDLLRNLLIDEKGEQSLFFSETIFALVQKGWLLQNKATDNFKMHRIIMEVIKLQLSPHSSELPFLVNGIVDKLNYTPTDNPVDNFRWIPFGYALVEYLSQETSQLIAVLHNNLALTLKNQGEYLEAKEQMIKAVRLDEIAFGPYSPTTAIRYSNLSSILLDLGDLEMAKVYIEKAILADEKNFGKDHPTTSKRYSNLAMILQEMKDYENAKLLMEKAVLIDEKNLGNNHPTTARRYSNLALVLKDMGEIGRAKMYMEKALQSDIKNFGTEHPTVAKRYINFGAILQDARDYQGAMSYMEKAQMLNEKNYGPRHPVVAHGYANIASVLVGLNKHQEALLSYEKALGILDKVLPVEHLVLTKIKDDYLTVKMFLESK